MEKEENRSNPFYSGVRKDDKMPVLNYNNSYYNLIVDKLYQKGNIQSQEEIKVKKIQNTCQLIAFKEPNHMKTDNKSVD